MPEGRTLLVNQTRVRVQELERGRLLEPSERYAQSVAVPDIILITEGNQV